MGENVEMKSAKEIKKIQEDAIRDSLENKFIKLANSGYNTCVCSRVECPDWLQKELIKKGFEVFDKEGDPNFLGISIKW